MIEVFSTRFSKMSVAEYIYPAPDETSTQLTISKLVALHNNKPSTSQKIELTLMVSSTLQKTNDVLEKISETNKIHAKTIQAIIVQTDVEKAGKNLPANLADYLEELHAKLEPLNIKLGISLHTSQCKSEPDTSFLGNKPNKAYFDYATERVLKHVDLVLFGGYIFHIDWDLLRRFRECYKAVKKVNNHASVHLGPTWESGGSSIVWDWDELGLWGADLKMDFYVESAFDTPMLANITNHKSKGSRGWFCLKDPETLNIRKESFIEKTEDLNEVSLWNLKHKSKERFPWNGTIGIHSVGTALNIFLGAIILIILI